MKWTIENIETEIKKAMSELGVNRMPTSQELRSMRKTGLSAAIGKNGGMDYWKEKLSLSSKEKIVKWDNQLLREEIEKSIKILGLNRFPTAEELKSIGRNDLHCKIGRTKKYSGWAKEFNLELKTSTTTLGLEYELNIAKILKTHGFESEKMTTKHPYDLLVEKVLKIDVKIANAYLLRGKDRVHTFNLQKEKPTCDIYICVALDEQKEVERCFIIPSHHVQMRMLNVGKESKYNKYVDKFDYIKKYVDFLTSI